MVSDVLHDAVAEIDEYLSDAFYTGDLRERIIAVRNQMNELRRELDRPPQDS